MNPTNLSTYPLVVVNGTTYNVRLTNFAAGCFPRGTTFDIETGTNDSTWSLTLNGGVTGFLHIVVNGTTVINQTSTGSGSVSFAIGDSVFVACGMTVAGTVNLIVTDVTTSTILSNTSTTGLSPLTSYSFIANGDIYSMVGTGNPTTTTTSTTTTTTTT
jgi:hypothetical protein